MKLTAPRVLALLSALALSPLALTASDEPASGTASPDKVVYDASSAFEFLKTLSGEWERANAGEHAGHGAATTKPSTFRVSAAGSNVISVIYPGDPNEMTNVFHRDGDDLLLTHYCALQNAPVMKFVKSEVPGEIRFAFQGGTNFDPNVDAHVHEGVFRVKDANTIESAFVTFANGKPGPGTNTTIRRKASS
jgi:hypothetical protein